MFVLMLKIGHETRRTWLAEIQGRSKKWGFAREFVAAAAKKLRGGIAEYLIDEDRLYECAEDGERYFVMVKDGAVQRLDKPAAIAVLEAIERRDREAAGEIDARIARFNAEGGFSLN